MDDFRIKIVVLGVVSELLSTVETDKARIRRRLDVKVFGLLLMKAVKERVQNNTVWLLCTTQC